MANARLLGREVGGRPAPPEQLFDGSNWSRYLVPADGVNDWVHHTFLRDGAQCNARCGRGYGAPRSRCR
ncbi:hypothetical protein C6P91_31300 [Burkholderia multivorans]|nr:hypothetical protein C6P91_31300 [Burkholderia multivorans]